MVILNYLIESEIVRCFCFRKQVFLCSYLDFVILWGIWLKTAGGAVDKKLEGRGQCDPSTSR